MVLLDMAVPGRHARQTPEWTGGAEDLTGVVQCCRPCGGRQQALSPTGTPRSGPAGQAALAMSTEPQSSGGFQSSLAVCALGEAAGMQEWAVGGGQGRAPSQQWAEGDAGRGTPAAFAASSRPSHPRTCPCPCVSLQQSTLQGHHSQNSQDEAGPGRDSLGRTGSSLSPILPLSLLCFCPTLSPPQLAPFSTCPSCSLVAVWPMLSSVLLQIQADTRKQQQA